MTPASDILQKIRSHLEEDLNPAFAIDVDERRLLQISAAQNYYARKWDWPELQITQNITLALGQSLYHLSPDIQRLTKVIGPYGMILKTGLSRNIGTGLPSHYQFKPGQIIFSPAPNLTDICQVIGQEMPGPISQRHHTAVLDGDLLALYVAASEALSHKLPKAESLQHQWRETERIAKSQASPGQTYSYL